MDDVVTAPAATPRIVGLASHLPENRVPAAYFRQFADADSRTLTSNPMFAPPAYRHGVIIEPMDMEKMNRPIWAFDRFWMPEST